jgi:hypothetical protein
MKAEQEPQYFRGRVPRTTCWRGEPMSSLLEELNRNELQAASAVLLAKAEALPKGDPKRVRLLLAAQHALDKAARDASQIGLSSKPLRGSHR